MDVHAARSGEKMLRRLMALLAGLAVLADRTAPRSWAVRCVVLWILRRAESVARDFVLAETGAPAALEPFVAVSHGPDAAFALAGRFRALAALLAALLPAPCPFVRRAAGCGFAFAGFRAGPAPARPARAPNDTS